MTKGKKDFSAAATNVYNTIAEATEEIQETQQRKAKFKDRKTYTAEESAEFLADFKTRGRKGLKLPRITIAFTPDNFDYIKTMARVAGVPQSEFVNEILAQYKAEHLEQYEKAVEFRNGL